MSRRILNGWKKISGHIERSVRTAQRWEAHMGMPVHRPAGKDSGVVVAFTDELDRWICRAAVPAPEREDETLLRMLEDMSTMVWDTEELATQMRLLQEQLRRSLPPCRRRNESLRRLLKFPVVAPNNGTFRG